jgi:hypothetical protein
MRGGMK